MIDPQSPSSRGSVGEVIRVFLRLGFTAFGGPAAHIALFRDEVVTRRGWVTDEEFLDLLGITNMIPGPNSTELVIHLGYLRAGWRGLIAAGVCFTLPAMLIVLVLAMIYVQYGTTPAAVWLLYGIKPVIIAVIVQAIWGLVRRAARTRLLVVIGLAAFGLYLAGVNELILLFGGGAVVLALRGLSREKNQAGPGLLASLGLPFSGFLAQTATSAVPVSLGLLFLSFLKIGAVMYGSGYVLLAFFRSDFIDRLAWLTNQQLLDAVAIGQFTPGPLFTSATFIGYLIAGLPGALVATLGIFLPSFLFVGLSGPLLARLRRSVHFRALLDGINVAAIGLMAGVTLELGQQAIVDGFTALLAVGAAVLLVRWRVSTTWLIVGGGLIGLIRALLGG